MRRPLPGADGDLARACDDQLLDFLRAVKRMDDERKTLIELRNHEHDYESDAAYDASTDGEAERQEAQQTVTMAKTQDEP